MVDSTNHRSVLKRSYRYSIISTMTYESVSESLLKSDHAPLGMSPSATNDNVFAKSPVYICSATVPAKRIKSCVNGDQPESMAGSVIVILQMFFLMT